MKKIGYLKGLDGVRALAILLIAAYHYWPTGNKILTGGFIGVEIFFVISGFIITLTLVREWEGQNRIDLKNFWVHRIRRLFPALILLILAVVFLAAVLPQASADIESSKMAVVAQYIPDFSNELSALKYQIVAAFFYVINWYFIFQGKSYFDLTDRPPLFGHLWSLAIEEQFYLLWPLALILILKLAKNRNHLVVISCLALALASVMAMLVNGQNSPNDARAYFGTDARIYSLIAGATLAIMFGKVQKLVEAGRLLRWGLEILGIASFLTILGLSFTLVGGELRIFRGGLLSVTIATCFLIVSATCIRSRFSRIVFESRIVTWIGQRSYGIYLWHWPIFILTEPGYNYQIEGVELMIIRILVLLVVTEISFRLIEKPIRNGAIGKIIQGIRAERGRERWAGYKGRNFIPGFCRDGSFLPLIGFDLSTERNSRFGSGYGE